jgi:hypothetical protein
MGVLARVDAYQAAGYEVLAGPCLDWGVFVPRHSHCLLNTEAWAMKARAAQMRGMINTGWAVFHVPLPVKWLHAAATGALMNASGTSIDRAWQRAFLESEYGTDIDGVVDALETVSRQWEVSCEGLGRPLNPIGYGYMEMILHFPGGQADRRKRGAYPLDWNKVDFIGMHRRKMALLRDHPDAAEICRKARELVTAYDAASATLHTLAQTATTHRNEAALLSLFADMKLLRGRILIRQLTGEGRAGPLCEAIDAEQPRLEACLAPFLDPASIARMRRIWWEPVRETLCSV